MSTVSNHVMKSSDSSSPQPLIADIMSSLGKATSLPADFEGTQKLRLWLKKLNDLRAADEIEEDECRQVRVAHSIIISSFVQ